MRNAYAKLYKVDDVLLAGWNDKSQEPSIAGLTPVWESPAFVSTPSRSWQQASALEGLELLNLSIHTRTDLNDVNVIVISQNAKAGRYGVESVSVNGDGTNWLLLMGKRP